MSRLLLSFPNQRKGIISPLAVLDTDTEHCEIIDLNIGGEYVGTTGLCRLENGAIIVGLMGPHHGFAVLTPKDFRVLYAVQHPEIQEPHSMIGASGSSILVCSAGNDTIFRVNLEVPRPIEKVWQHPDQHPDIPNFHHVNSITQTVEGHLLITHFGEKVKPEAEASWWLNTEGRVVDISAADRTLVLGLFHPHSIIEYPRGFLVCESSARKVYRFYFDGSGMSTIELSGYTRGIAWNLSNIFVGLSVSRPVSRRTGEVNPLPPAPLRMATVAILTHDFELQRLIELPDCGEEIYDIMIL